MRRRTKRILIGAGVLAIAAMLACNLVVLRGGGAEPAQRHLTPSETVIVVLGAGVHGDEPSEVLRDRLETALELFRAGRATKILVTGDHSKKDYDEPGAMARYLAAHGVHETDIVLDHAGFDTYSSIVRAREVFGVTHAIVVTQRFHLSRALWVARSVGIDAEGAEADRRVYRAAGWFEAREILSRTKAWIDVTVGRRPRYPA
ncbi:MAG: SanA/YdcF family protein [Polyangiales bacterium]